MFFLLDSACLRWKINQIVCWKNLKNRPGKKNISAVRDIEGRRCIDDKEMNNIF